MTDETAPIQGGNLSGFESWVGKMVDFIVWEGKLDQGNRLIRKPKTQNGWAEKQTGLIEYISFLLVFLTWTWIRVAIIQFVTGCGNFKLCIHIFFLTRLLSKTNKFQFTSFFYLFGRAQFPYSSNGSSNAAIDQ